MRFRRRRGEREDTGLFGAIDHHFVYNFLRDTLQGDVVEHDENVSLLNLILFLCRRVFRETDDPIGPDIPLEVNTDGLVGLELKVDARLDSSKPSKDIAFDC